MTLSPQCHRALALCKSTCIFACFSFLVLFPNRVEAQFPDGCTLNCTANDVEEIIAFLGDADTMMLDIDCEIGSPVNDVIIWIQITFNSNASREPIRWIGDIVTTPPTGSPVVTEFEGCINDGSTQGESVVLLAADTISWTCGDEILIENFLAGWAQPGGGQTCTDCPNNSKCIFLPDIYVQAPLTANFIDYQECVEDENYEVITYVDRTVGGIPPYTYSWDFGTGATPMTSTEDSVVVEYSSLGVKSVSLTVTDSEGDISSISRDTFEVDLCCELQVSCPGDQIYACADDVPAIPSSFQDNVQGTDTADFNDIDGLSLVVNSCSDLIITVSESDNGGSGCPGDTLIITRVLTLYDDINNNDVLEQIEIDLAHTCTYKIAVVDSIDPVITTAAMDMTVECDGLGNNDALSNWLASNASAAASDDCSSVSWSNDFETFNDSCGTTGAVTVKFTAMDVCGNTATTTATFTIQDNQAPEVNCADTLFLECGVTLDPSQNSDISAWLDEPSGTDVCSEVTLDSNSYDSADFSDLCGATGVLNVTFYLSDDCNNVSTCTGVIVIEDNTAPEVNCPDTLFLECGVSLVPEDNDDIGSWLGDPSGIDDCSVVTLDSNSYDMADFSDLCGTTGVLNVTFYLSDDCNNVSTCTGVIVIEDNTAPEVNCPDTLFLECGVSLDPGQNSDISTWLDAPSGTDDCSVVTLDSNSYDVADYSDLCGTTGVLNVTFYLSDDCNNVSTCTGVVVIEDNTAPDVICPDTLFLECGVSLDPGQNSEISTWLDTPSGTDDCSVVTLDSNSYDPADYSDLCGTTGVLNVTFYLSDDCNNVSTCTGVVVIEDNTAPDVICPDTLFLECGVSLDPGQNSDISIWLDAPSGSDDCSVVTLDSNTYEPSDYSDLCGATGVLHVTFFLSDDCSNISTCTGVIVVEDNTAPEVNCPDTLFLECGVSLVPDENNDLENWLSDPSGTDDCSVVTLDSNSYEAVDFSDLCGTTGVLNVTFYLSDDCENVTTCTGVIVIQDNTAPQVNCPDTLFLECGVSLVPEDNDDIGNWLAEPSGTDDCSEVTLDSNSYDMADFSDLCGTTGILNVTFYLSDDCNNVSTCTGVIVIEDNTAPQVNCPDTLFLECGVSLDPGDNSDIGDWLAEPDGNDDCSEVTLDSNSYDLSDFSDLCGTTGVLNVTFYLSDDCNNVSTCTGVIVIEDNTAPEVNCPDTLFLECGVSFVPAENMDLGDWLAEPTGTDDCSVVTLDSNSYDAADFSDLCGGTGVLNVTFYLSDDCSNVSSCTGVIVIEDNISPVVNCPDTLFLECGVSLNPDENSDISTWLDAPSGSDDCSEVTLDSDSYEQGGFTNLCGATGVQNVTFYLSDDCGNESTCTGVIVIEDNTPPVVNCPSETLEIECGESLSPLGNGELAAWLADADGTDACGSVTLDSNSYTMSGFSDLCGATGNQTVTFYLSDECDNVSTCTAEVHIIDTRKPKIDCPGDLVLDCAQGNYAALISAWLLEVSADDDCGSVSLSNDYDGFSIPDLSCNMTEGIDVTFTAEDECGLTETCVATIFLTDQTPPQIVLDAQYVNLACDIVPEEFEGGYSASDACGDVTMTSEVTEGFCVFDPKNISSGSGNPYSPTNWFKISVGGLNEAELTAADIKSLSLLYDVNTSSGGNGGKGQVEFWLVNPCNEAIRLIGPYCVNNSNDPNDLGCEQQGLFHPVFEFTDPCRPEWDNNMVVNNTGVPEKFAPYGQVSGTAYLGSLEVSAVTNAADFTCEEINGDWYLFGRKDNSENASIQFQEVCLMTCPEAYTRELTATDQCNQSTSVKHYLVMDDECSDCYDTWYVDIDASGLNNGTSWSDAFNDLQDALYQAVKGDTIWVAEGMYYPTNDLDRSATFMLNGGVHIFGGFEGGETELGARDPLTNPTILSGNIGAAGDSDNSYHVITVPDCVEAGHLNGFFVEHGFADGSGDDAYGAGVISFGDAVFEHVVIRWSSADGGGHAIYNIGNKGFIILDACRVIENGPPADLSILNENGATIEVTNNTEVR